MKKILTSGLVLTLAFVFSAGVSSAFGGNFNRHDRHEKDSTPEVKVENTNHSHVKSTVKAESNTGNNKIGTQSHENNNMTLNFGWNGNSGGDEADIETSEAESYAGAELYVGDNYTEVDTPRHVKKVEVKNNNHSHVYSYVKAESNTGHNYIGGNNDDAEIDTGHAYSDTEAFTVVGTNVTKIE